MICTISPNSTKFLHSRIFNRPSPASEQITAHALYVRPSPPPGRPNQLRSRASQKPNGLLQSQRHPFRASRLPESMIRSQIRFPTSTLHHSNMTVRLEQRIWARRNPGTRPDGLLLPNILRRWSPTPLPRTRKAALDSLSPPLLKSPRGLQITEPCLDK